MNNGLHVGPIISRRSPRWQMKEFYNGLHTGGSFKSGLFEPYIPPNVSAVMVTATSGGTVGSGNLAYPAASCHNVVFPKTNRRLFIEFTTTGAVYIMVVAEADIMASGSSQLSMSICEHALLLQAIAGGANPSAIAYSKNAAGYITAALAETRPYLNGVIAGCNNVTQSASLIDPRLRANGPALTQNIMGNLFFPVRMVSSNTASSPGTGQWSTGTPPAMATPSYLRLEYIA